MLTLSDQDLLNYNAQGLIPGPNESEADFVKRAEYCLSLYKTLSSKLDEEIPFQPEDSATLSIFKKAKTAASQLFDISPEWLPIFFSNYQLYPWHGGCAWIFQLTDDSPTSAFLQLRKNLHHSDRLFGYYDRDELIAHELSHVGRMNFEEPQFEKVLAYQTSHSAFRRYFGPIIQSSVESFVFVLILMGIVALDTFLIIWHPETYWQAMWLKIFPIALIVYGVFRLWKKQRAFAMCKKALEKQFGQKANTVLYRLTDKEILNPQNIKDDNSLRWRLIKLAYSNNA